MDWLQSLLWDPSSVAHIVFLYAFVVAAGVYLGKIKIFGVSLGVTFVLFAGILMGHFGFTADTHILHFIREFGLILFVFCIGLQVGPSFFSSFKKGGMTLNLLAVGIVVLNIAVAPSVTTIGACPTTTVSVNEMLSGVKEISPKIGVLLSVEADIVRKTGVYPI